MFTLAQPAQPKADILPVVFWLGILIVVTVVGGLVVLAIRKRILAKSTSAGDEASLMDSLRALRDRGEMSNEEFEATRRAMIERMRSNLAAQGQTPKPGAPPLARPRSDDSTPSPPSAG